MRNLRLQPHRSSFSDCSYTRFNDISLLNGSFDSVEIQAGTNTEIVVTIDDMTASGLSIQAATIATQAGAQAAITTMDTALETIATEQATRSLINRFSFSVNNLSKASVATEQAVDGLWMLTLRQRQQTCRNNRSSIKQQRQC